MGRNRSTGADALSSVLEERKFQNMKWGEQNHDPFTWVAILAEEVGEFTHEALVLRFAAVIQRDVEKLRTECVQVAAVALAMVECIDRGKWRWPRED